MRDVTSPNADIDDDEDKPYIPDPIVDCKVEEKHEHPAHDAANLWRLAEWYGWFVVDELVNLHQNPQRRATFERTFSEEPWIDSLEEFAGQMRRLEWEMPSKLHKFFPKY